MPFSAVGEIPLFRPWMPFTGNGNGYPTRASYQDFGGGANSLGGGSGALAMADCINTVVKIPAPP